MNDEDLIECVREYDVLYDPLHEKYRDDDYKNGIWSKIGNKLKTSGEFAIFNHNSFLIWKIL